LPHVILRQNDEDVAVDITVTNSPVDFTTVDAIALVVYDSAGIILKEWTCSAQSPDTVRASIPLVDLSPGIYFAEIEVVKGTARYSSKEFFVEVQQSPKSSLTGVQVI